MKFHKSRLVREASQKNRLLKRDGIPRVRPLRTWGPDVFSSRSPTDLEFGCGVGLHPIRYAQAKPERHLIAIEQTREKYGKFQRRLEKHRHIQNLTALHTNAISWITHFCPSESLESVILLYPNPERKNPSKRWFLIPFFSEILRVLKTGGEIILAKNEKFYHDEALEAAIHQWGLKLLDAREIKAQDGVEGRTHFEIKYLKRGQTCYELRFTKEFSQ